MEGLYKVVEIDRSSGLLHLRAAGGRQFRVQLGPQALSGFAMGMRVRLRKSKRGGLVLESAGPGGREQPAAGQHQVVKESQRRDRRGFPRAAFGGQTTVLSGADAIQCIAQDISERGIALQLPQYQQLEEQLELAFRLPNGQRMFKISGVVARVARTASGAVWGVGFQQVPKEATSALQSYIAAGLGGERQARRLSKIDRSLAGLYQDAMAGLKKGPGSP